MITHELENPMDINSLTTAFRNGVRLKYLFFWGHQPRLDGQIGKNCLSQWWESSFTLDGITYPTAEHFMMAEKARLFQDYETCVKILAAPHPGAAKKFGREVQGFDNQIWQEKRFDIVVRGNWAKFSQDDALKTFLLKTNQRILVEASPYDTIWGIGLAEDDPAAEKPEKWKGLNLLGFALMAVRGRLVGDINQPDR
jgi:ribA/ribD-fused uncharacterized protein